MSTARTVRTALGIVLMAATSLLVGALASPARAGGPTSVLLVAPGGGGTASLYYDDPRYDALSRLVTSEAGPGAGAFTHETADLVTVTWLIHDVLVWRVDRVYLGAADGPWVASQESSGSDIGDAPVTWHQPAEPKALLALLRDLGLAGGLAAVPDAVASPLPAGGSTDSGAGGAESTPWLLLAGAAAAGAVVAAGLTLTVTRRAATLRAEAPTAAQDEGADWSPAEVLTGP